MMTLATASSSRSQSGTQQKLLIGIDFGTTLSAIGWVLTNQPQHQHIIRDWPEVALSDEKVPTLLCYDDYQKLNYRWGFQVDEQERRHEWFKLGLYPGLEQSPLAQQYPSNTAFPRVYGEECENIIRDYLKSLKKHATSIIEDKFGNALRSVPREYTVTVPAIWSEKAQNTTRQCAVKAGMGSQDSIHIITEPEAAGIYALRTMAGLNLKENDTFVVCDAGGGTVDLISYTVKSLKPIPALEEASAGSGYLCGSVFLNRIFDNWLKRRFERYQYWDDGYQADAMRKWETDLKRNFMGDTTKDYTIPARNLPDNARLGIRNGRLTITGKEVRDIFEPVVREIVRLVEEQVRAIKSDHKRVTAILLAGGFGANRYLKQRIEEAITFDGSNIRVIKIENCHTAIVRGALIRGIAEREPTRASIRVDSRKARKHYGTLTYDEYRPGYHDPFKKEHDPLNGIGRVLCYRWFVKKDERVAVSKPASFSYYFERKKSQGHPGVINMVVYACEDIYNIGAPLYEDKGSVKRLVNLKADLKPIPESMFETTKGQDGLLYYKVNFEIEMTVHSASMTFALVYENTRYDTVQQEFE